MNGEYITERVTLRENEFKPFTEFTEQQFKSTTCVPNIKELKQNISEHPTKKEIEQYLWNYRLGNILARYPPRLLDYAIDIIRTTLELDMKEKGRANIDDTIQKIFGTGLVQLRKYNEARKRISTKLTDLE